MPRVAMFVFAALAVVVSQGSVIKVPQDQPTIQAAINVAATGDAILVAPGMISRILTSWAQRSRSQAAAARK